MSTQDVLNCFVAALGGTLKLIADFGDEQLKPRSSTSGQFFELKLLTGHVFLDPVPSSAG